VGVRETTKTGDRLKKNWEAPFGKKGNQGKTVHYYGLDGILPQGRGNFGAKKTRTKKPTKRF